MRSANSFVSPRSTRSAPSTYNTAMTVRLVAATLLAVFAAGAAGETCYDADWTAENGKDCDWVKKNPGDRCGEVGEISARVACRATCATSLNAKADSTTWFYEKNDKIKGCDWVAKMGKHEKTIEGPIGEIPERCLRSGKDAARAACCACASTATAAPTGGLEEFAEVCEDTNGEGLDRGMDDCDYYATGHACGQWDDEDFVASDMCCGCGGGEWVDTSVETNHWGRPSEPLCSKISGGLAESVSRTF